MKRKKGLQISLSNKFLYALVIGGIFTIICVGVYALTPGVSPNPGHVASNISAPTGCSANNTITWNGTDWKCNTSLQKNTTLYKCTKDSCQCSPPIACTCPEDRLSTTQLSGYNCVVGGYTVK